MAIQSMPGQGRRICLAFPSMLPLGGAERVQVDLAREFHSLGFELDIVIADEPHDASPYFSKKSRIFTFATPRTRNFIRSFTAYLRAERPDMVISSMWPFTTACVIAARLARTRTPVVVAEHNMLSVQYAEHGFMHRALMRSSIAVSYRLAAARVAVSTGVSHDLTKLAWLGQDSVNVIHNPVYTQSTKDYSILSDNIGKVWPDNCARLLAVGRLKAQKNYPLLLQAILIVLRKRAAHLVILGTGPEKDAILQLVRSLKLENHVTLLGHVEDVENYYINANLFVLSSDYEGFGNVIVEAMSFGIPVVSTDCPSGPSEILGNGMWGRLVPVGDALALSAAIEAELDMPHPPSDLKKRAADFLPEIAARKYLASIFPEFSSKQMTDLNHKDS